MRLIVARTVRERVIERLIICANRKLVISVHLANEHTRCWYDNQLPRTLSYNIYY